MNYLRNLQSYFFSLYSNKDDNLRLKETNRIIQLIKDSELDQIQTVDDFWIELRWIDWIFDANQKLFYSVVAHVPGDKRTVNPTAAFYFYNYWMTVEITIERITTSRAEKLSLNPALRNFAELNINFNVHRDKLLQLLELIIGEHEIIPDVMLIILNFCV